MDVVRKSIEHVIAAWRCLMVIAVFQACFPCAVLAVNYYFDVNGGTSGFGSPSGIYSQNDSCWNTSGAGDLATIPFSAANIMVFGTAASDFQGATFTINMNGAQMSTDGITINATNVNITFQGAANLYLGNNQTWTVPRGSVFNEAQTWNVGMNFDNTAVLLTGGGIINFITPIGCNSGARITENDGGGGLTVNLHAGRSTNTVWSGGVTLTSGNLNLANTAATNTFGTGSVIIEGGKIDNTSGSFMTLCDMSGYTFGGSFTFGGSSSLSLGRPNVTLTASPVITVSSNVLTIPGAISGSYSITKAGPGTLALDGTNIYSGVTTVSGGALMVNGSITSSVTVASGGILAGTGTVNNAVVVQAGGGIDAGGSNTYGMLAINGNVTINGSLNADINGSGECDLINAGGALDISSCSLNINSSGTLGNRDYVIASYTSLSGSQFANIYNLPTRYVIHYNYKGENKIAVALQRGMVLLIK